MRITWAACPPHASIKESGVVHGLLITIAFPCRAQDKVQPWEVLYTPLHSVPLLLRLLCLSVTIVQKAKTDLSQFGNTFVYHPLD